MSEPIVFISRFRIMEGKRGTFASAYANAVDLIGATKPRTALYAAFVDAGGTEVRIVHAFPDAAALASHFEGSDDRGASVADLLVLIGFELYGPAPEAAIEQLRHEAARSQAELRLFSESLGGFIRAAPSA